MTAHANRLIKRANTDAAAVQTDAASNVRVYIDGLEKLGYTTEALLRTVGLRRSDLDEPDGRVPCAAVGAILGMALQERPLKNLGCRIASETPIGAFPVIDYLIVTSENVGEGLRHLAHYFRLVSAPVTITFKDTPQEIYVEYEGPPHPFGYEFAVSLDVFHLREETEGRFQAEYVSFTHMPEDVAEFERMLGCRVRPRSSWNGLCILRQAWQLPLRRRDPALHHVLKRHANEMLSALPAGGGTALEVRRLLVSRVAGCDTRIESVARSLGTSPRSLQRQLAIEGTSYQSLVDDTRSEAAQRYLTNSSLPIAEIAYLLGYSEVAAFHRAFKRWTGCTPQTFRANNS